MELTREYYGAATALTFSNSLFVGIGRSLYVENQGKLNKILEIEGSKICGIDVKDSFILVRDKNSVHFFEDCVLKEKKQFNEFLVCAKILSNNQIAVGTVSNKVIVGEEQFPCPKQCIAYSMDIVEEDDLTVVSGNPFRSIIVWTVKAGQATLLRTLEAHLGVIFHVQIYKNELLTCSDDRTVILWEDFRHSDKKTVFFGHKARVWTAKYSAERKMIVSAGEDAKICVYDTVKGTKIREITGHLGKNIRQLELNEDFIYSAGEDCQIKKTSVINKSTRKDLIFEGNEIKCLLFENDTLYCGDKKGQLIACKQENRVVLFADTDQIAFSSLTKKDDTFYLGNCRGELTVLTQDSTEKLQIFNKTRVIYCNLQGNTLFLANPLGEFSVLPLEKPYKPVNYQSKAKNPITACLFLSNEVFLTGNFQGTVSKYSLEGETVTFLDSVHIGKKEKITQISIDEGKLSVAGRDGLIHRLQLEPLKIRESLKFPEVSMIEYFNEKLIFGVHYRYLLIQDRKTNSLVDKFDIKGVNRPYSIQFNPPRIALAYKEKVSIFSSEGDSEIIRESSHGKTIYALCVVKVKETNIMLSGSEDTRVLIHRVKGGEIEQISCFSRHTAAVRSIAVLTVDSEVFVLSGGGYSELFLSKLTDEMNLELVASLSDSNKVLDRRFMSVFTDNTNLLGASCTDGRTYIWKHSSLELVLEKEWNTIGVPLCGLIQSNTLIEGSSDGFIRTTDLSNNTETLVKMHEGGVNTITSQEDTVFSAGEDCKIGIFSLNNPKTVCYRVTAHYSPIKSLSFLGNTLVSFGYDQNVCLEAETVKSEVAEGHSVVCVDSRIIVAGKGMEII